MQMLRAKYLPQANQDRWGNTAPEGGLFPGYLLFAIGFLKTERAAQRFRTEPVSCVPPPVYPGRQRRIRFFRPFLPVW
jgi:hypothetical protein